MIKIGHRGAMGYAPENTLLSFKKAIPFSDMVELDVYVCKTGEVVVFHDHRLERCTNGSGYVMDKTFTELRTLDAGQGQQIPTLEEVLDLIDNQVAINIELKGPGTAGPVFKIVDQYVKAGQYSLDRFVISSFNHPELLAFKTLAPQISIGCLISIIPVDLAAIAETVKADYLNVSGEFISQELVDDAHRRGLKVLVWTVNELDDIDYIKSLGVDGIFSNYPDRIT